MSSEKTSNEELVNAIDGDGMPSVDDFIRELEAKERDLHISSDLVIEVGDSSVEHDNIHDSFVASASFHAVPTAEEDESDEEEERKLREFSDTVNTSEAHFRAQIEELMSERDGLMDALRRQKIDFENYRSRTERDREDTYKNILSGIAARILPIVDNLERALDSTVAEDGSGEQDFGTFLEGVVLVNQQMNDVLADMGVEPIRALGESFDPNFHDAVDCVVTDHVPPKTIVEELARGYKINDRVVRPSMVKVSEALPEDCPPLESDNSPADETSD